MCVCFIKAHKVSKLGEYLAMCVAHEDFKMEFVPENVRGFRQFRGLRGEHGLRMPWAFYTVYV